MDKVMRSMKDVYRCCQDMDLDWDEADVLIVISMYNSNFSVLEMQAVLSRSHYEISVLILDLIRTGRITNEQKKVKTD